jgi:hypothetical protein
MKKNYKKLLKANNAIEPAAPASRFGKGVPGKGGASTNSEIPEWMFKRELKDMKEGKQSA